MTKAKILLVEDDENLSFVIKDNLEEHGFEVFCCADGKEGLKVFQKMNFDLCLLDVMLPKMDGFDLATEIRKKNENVPLIFLTAKGLKEDKIQGFTIGADDYITKPFSIEELVLRCKVFIKRTQPATTIKNKTYQIATYTFDVENQTLTYLDEFKNLTLREAKLLELLCENMGNVVKREEILKVVWGTDDYFAGRSMDVFISRLRKYLAKDARIEIVNFHSVGFKLDCKSSI